MGQTEAMRNTDEVVAAVREGLACTDEELRYAVRNLSIWQNSMVFPLARAINENPITDKTRRDLQRAYDSMREGNKVPLDKRLKGGSFEPGLSDSQRIERMASTTADAAMKLIGALSGLSAKAKE